MRGKARRTVALALLAGLILAGPVLAQVSAHYDLSWHVIAGGGGRTESANHILEGTVGQAVTGSTLGAGTHSLCSGYWCGLPAAHRIYLPLVIRS
jgi:hypothetical protein